METKNIINKIPKCPGVYMMKDKDNNTIYIGKSKNLRDRVKSYFFKSSNHSKKISRMVNNIDNIEFITTDTELDALILECKLIQEVKPMYNTLLKKYENYKYIKINLDKEFTYLEIDEEISDDSIYFGPYSIDKSRNLEEVKDIISDIYKLPKCKRFSKCINYDLGRCLGPCRDKITKDEYYLLIKDVISTLDGENNYVLENLENKINKEISDLNFEKAQEIKHNKDLIESLFKKQRIINSARKELILAWTPLNNNIDKNKVYLIRGGEVLGTKLIENKLMSTVNVKCILFDICTEIDSKKSPKREIDKRNIDIVNIINSYIKTNDDIEYLIL